jgi:hypothetical protein
MFDFWRTRKHRRREELRYAILDGQVRALLLVLDSMIELTPAENRDVLIELLKTQVGKGFTSGAPWLDKGAKKLYNDVLSMTLQNFIRVILREQLKAPLL